MHPIVSVKSDNFVCYYTIGCAKVYIQKQYWFHQPLEVAIGHLILAASFATHSWW